MRCSKKSRKKIMGFLENFASALHTASSTVSAASAAAADEASHVEKINDAEAFDMEGLPGTVVLATFAVCVATTIYMAWHATYAITRLMQFAYDTLIFFIRMLFVSFILTAIMAYLVPREEIAHINKACATILSRAVNQGWNMDALNSFTAFVKKLRPSSSF